MRQALERRLGIVLGTGVVILFLMDALQNQSVNKLTGAMRGVTQGHETLENLARLDSLVSDAALEADAYAMTGEPAHLQGCREATRRVPEILQKLQPPKGSDPERNQPWTALASQTSAVLAELQRAAEDRGADSRSNATSLAARRRTVDDARQAIRQMQKEERRRVKQWDGAVTANSRLATLSTTLGATLGLWLLIVASLVIHHYVVERRSSEGKRVLAMEALRNFDQAVYLADEIGLVLYANRAADALFGYEPGKLVGNDVVKLHDLSKPEGGQNIFSRIQARLITGDSWSGILTSYKRNRAPFLSSAKVSALELCGKKYWLFVQDGLAQRGQRDEMSEGNVKPSLQEFEPSEPLPVESAHR